MSLNTVRPYELSLWDLQDGFISVLKSIESENRGQIISPSMTLSVDGTQSLSFSIPMYYYDKDTRIENPLWNDETRGALICNLRKIKVIFNKGETEEAVYEFLITSIEESHTSGQLLCNVSCEGLAFQELGKVGYKIDLSQDVYLNEYEEWYASDPETRGDEPRPNINYWCDKLFAYSDWTYEIQMDWSAYDGLYPSDIEQSGKKYWELTDAQKSALNTTRANAGARRMDKVYEDEYVNGWTEDATTGHLNPAGIVSFQEKERIIEASKSNRYNISQTIAETFGVYCKYEYSYDSNYHIIGKKCIFYNTFIDDQSGSLDLNYPYQASSIKRTMDCSDTVTKLFVENIEDDSMTSGLITIADASANKTGEDYILNFDYVKTIGGLTDEQEEGIETFEAQVRAINQQLQKNDDEIIQYQDQLTKEEAALTIAQTSITLDKEQMEQALQLLRNITGGDTVVRLEATNPVQAVLLKDATTSNGYYLKISQEGVLDNTSEHPIKVYSTYSSGSASGEITGFTVDKDTNGNIVSLSNLSCSSDSKIRYITYSYKPALYYENVYNTYAKKLAADEAEADAYESKTGTTSLKIQEIEENSEALLTQKKELIGNFEQLMGANIREGSWTDSDYKNYGKQYNENVTESSQSTSRNLSFLYDSDLFDDEQKDYYEVGVLQEKTYYPCINISLALSVLIDHWNDLSFVYADEDYPFTKHSLTIGSQMQLGFLKRNDTISVVLILTDETLDLSPSQKTAAFLGVVHSTLSSSTVTITYDTLVRNLTWVERSENDGYTWSVPRIQINSEFVKTSSDEIEVKIIPSDTSLSELLLARYEDYSVLYKNYKYYITIKPENILFSAGYAGNTYNVEYTISNAPLALYLDALDVSKTNAFPQVSYEVSVNALDRLNLKVLYRMLNKIVSINDSDLKLYDTKGYIGELELSLDTPWEDSITIKNYKTKFEDLFSTIVASSEQMKAKEYLYNNTTKSFTTSGALTESSLQKSITDSTIDYSFQNGAIQIDEENGIYATSDKGVVAIQNGGIYCASEQDTAGNWLWNTGITPYGINASLLTAGQLDTNLIRIFAGDDLRFIFKGDGLYAYSKSDNGTADTNNYIVYNSDGLFFNKKVSNLDIKVVEVGWNGFKLRNNLGTEVFYADSDTGDLIIKGNVFVSPTSSLAGLTLNDIAKIQELIDVSETGLVFKSDAITQIKTMGVDIIVYKTTDPTQKATHMVVNSDGMVISKYDYSQPELAEEGQEYDIFRADDEGVHATYITATNFTSDTVQQTYQGGTVRAKTAGELEALFENLNNHFLLSELTIECGDVSAGGEAQDISGGNFTMSGIEGNKIILKPYTSGSVTASVTINFLRAENCEAPIEFNNFTFSSSGGTGVDAVHCYRSKVALKSCVVNCGGINANNETVYGNGVYCRHGSVSLNGCTGTCYNVCSVEIGGEVYIDGTTIPSGNIETLGGNVYTLVTPVSPVTPVTPEVTTTTVTIYATNSRTCVSTSQWASTSNKNMYQGSYNGESSRQANCWFSGLSALEGKTVVSATLTFMRVAGVGRSSNVTTNIYLCPYESPGGGTKITSLGTCYASVSIGSGVKKSIDFTAGAQALIDDADKRYGLLFCNTDSTKHGSDSYTVGWARFYGYGATDGTAPFLQVTYES